MTSPDFLSSGNAKKLLKGKKETQRRKQDMTSPDLLYSGIAKKLHKRRNKYQRRKLKFYKDRVDYSKIESDKRCGTISMQGVRVEILEDDLFSFEYDDLSARKYVFICELDVVKAHMLWVANGEQYNNNGPTHNNLRSVSIEYMNKNLTQPIIRELVAKKYKEASNYFNIERVKDHAKRDHEDAQTMGLNRIQSNSSSSDSDSFPLSKENSFDGPELASSSVSQLKKQDTTLPLEHTEDCGYMTFPISVVNADSTDQEPALKSLKTIRKPQKCDSNYRKSDDDQFYTTTFCCNDSKDIDFGSREVNALKVRLRKDTDFIEIDMTDVGNTLQELYSTLCAEFDILTEDIVCIVKLPNIRIRNDRDVQRIKAGRILEVEVQED